MQVELWLPGHPPSSNNLFNSGRGYRYKTREYLAFERLVQVSILRGWNLPLVKSKLRSPYRFKIELHAPNWITGKGTFLRKDAGNFSKAAQDAVCLVTGLRDEYCVEESSSKVVDPEKKCRLIFEFLIGWGQ